MYSDVDLTSVHQDVCADLFTPLDYNQIPKLFLGFTIKNAFEYDTLKCLDNVLDIAHFCGQGGLIEPLFLRGIFIDIPPIIDKIIDKINSIKSIDTSRIFKQYIKILSQYNLSCNTTYAYLLDGSYPIDVEHIEKVTGKPYTHYSNEILDNDSIPWFFKPEIKIFILTKSNTYINQNI